MDKLIIPNEISGNAVYGVAQVSYTVDGVSGKDYSEALTAAAFRHSVSIEDTTSAYAAVVRQRQQKVSDLGIVLAALAEAIATMDPKSNSTDKLSSSLQCVFNAQQLAMKYGINLNYTGVSYTDGVGSAKISYANATRAQNDVQYALDVEDNNLQQDLVSLQSFVSKRDNAYSAASQIVKKAHNASNTAIANIE